MRHTSVVAQSIRSAVAAFVCAVMIAASGCAASTTDESVDSASAGAVSPYESGEWVAVQVEDGTTLFGTVSGLSSLDTLVLDDTYFIAASERAEANTLRRFGTEIHKPLATVAISAAAILAVQPLSGDSEALSAIDAAEQSEPALEAQSELVPAGSLQAVFLRSDEVYFGRLTVTDGYLILDDAHFLQFKEGRAAGSEEIRSLDDVTLVPQAKSPVGGTGRMVFPQEKVRYFQTLTEDSPVVEALSRD